MALFSKDTTKKAKAPKADKKSEKPEAQLSVSTGTVRDILRMPRITEKASLLAQRNIVVFDVSPEATKREIIDAVKKSYGVTPRSVKILAVRAKTVRHMRTGRMGVSGGGKKAYVYLKEGDSISIA